MPVSLSLFRRVRRRLAYQRNLARIARTLPYTGIVSQTENIPILVATTGAAPTRFNASRAFDLLVQQCEIGPRIPGTSTHTATKAFLTQELGLWVDEVATQEWKQLIQSGPGVGTVVPLSNIFGLIRGTEEATTTQEALRPRLMLCAHWDTRPVADRDPLPANRALPIPGANDGASGVAVLLELARVLHQRRPRHSILFTFFDGEDLGEYYYGSRLYARHIHRPALQRWRPHKAILLDMVGKANLCCTSELFSQKYAPTLWQEVQASVQRCGLERHFAGPKQGISDDHVFLNQAGIPAVLLIDYAYPQWHTTHDTVEQCSSESLQIVADVLLDYVFSEHF